jgi:UrcA family protein
MAGSSPLQIGAVTQHLNEEIVMSSSHPIIGKACLASCAALLLSCALCLSNAVAEDLPRSETVKFGDLEMSTYAGVEALYMRIHAAAQRVCWETDPLLQIAEYHCVRKAETRAVEKVNLPSLTAYYRTRNAKHAELLRAQR